ncbi:MAG: amidohydrolase [Albidovulum sp.]|nr:amidohydrolase [Albidovulum sp.]
MPIKNRFSEMFSQIREWRRDIHAHPELLFDTVRTAGKVTGLLKEFGCDEVVERVGRIGVVGVIKGRQNDSGKVIALRADMDALPIKEDTGVDYASVNEGVMHACGHDGHTAMLLGASKYLAETRNFDGTAIVVFQPAEEGGGGGKEMVEDGLMERFGIQEIYGMHNMPTLPVGEFAIRTGSFFASADSFTIEVTGVGGHAAKPDLVADPTLASSQIVIALQSIASRNVNPVQPVVVSVTSFRTATDTHNVIPGKVVLKGTVRALDEEARALAEKRLGEIAETTATALGTEASVVYERGYPVMVNADRETDFAIEAAGRIGTRVETEAPLVMGAEDFAFMLNERPGSYILVGNGDSAPLHNEKYNFNDETIPVGCSWWAEIAESRMPLN